MEKTSNCNVLDIILKPFKENLFFFLSLWLLASSADSFFWTIHGDPVFGAYMGVHGFIECYFIVLICGIFQGAAFKVIKCIMLALGVVSLIADALVQEIMHFSFTGDMVAIIMGSNPSEASEFLPMYFTPRVMAFIAVMLVLVAALLCLGKKNIKVSKWVPYFLIAFLLASITVVSVRKSKNWEGVFLNKIALFINYEPAMDLTPYRTTPSVTINGDQPDIIVTVIGESLSKRHCSIYGYEKETTPCLESLLSDSLLIRYANATSPYVNTIGSFKSLMSTYKSGYQSKNWYEYTFLMDAMKSAGYHSYWISNQSSIGIYDNIVARFAELADEVHWLGTQGMGIGKHDLDEIAIPALESVLEEAKEKTFIVVHLMGSHEGFSSRYPEAYSVFHEEDYQDALPNQRKTLSEYDNSILYNDMVVSSLMKLIDGRNGLMLYFPDHALDIFYTDPEYIGHARTSDPESYTAGCEIPFVIYTPVSYKIRNPETLNILQSRKDEPYCTGDLISTLLTIANSSLSE